MKKIFKKLTAVLLAVSTGISAISGLSMNVTAATKQDIYIIDLPRGNDSNQSGWGHPALNFMNGWSVLQTNFSEAIAVDSFEGKSCYCIEPGVPLFSGNVLSKEAEEFWKNYPSKYNKSITPDEIKLFIGRIMQYGWTGNNSYNWVSQNSSKSDECAEYLATQLLVWETVVGERDEDFNKISAADYGKKNIKAMIQSNHPLYTKIFNYYDEIVKKVKNHTKIPSFTNKSASKADTVELKWNGSKYTVTLTDSNKVLSDYSFSGNGLKFSKDGNKLTITADEAPSGTVKVTADKKESKRKSIITWTDEIYDPDSEDIQDVVTYGESVNDPVKAFLNVKVSYGSIKIQKSSEDSKVSGISFTISGNGVNKTVQTNSSGVVQVDNLPPGTYTITEQLYDKYVPQEAHKVTVVGGQVSTVSFNNKLKRGKLTVTKNSEDGLNQGVKFHLYGTSLSGIKVDEYAVTNANGIATFNDILIGTGFTLEEVDTAIRYVIPKSQTSAVEWNKVTNKTVANILKKFCVTVTKSDIETKSPQGDASLAGAKYGIYKGDKLIDTYTTDANGQFTTKYYVCGDDWSIREISPSEGYLLDEKSYHVGAEAKLYTVEYNKTKNDVTEQVIKGNISIIKHTDDGKTQIETPEKGAEFEVYLKSSGSYEKAKDTEKDHLICDENGYAQTKDMPYGIYTVHQVSGWEGREKIKDFDVYIAKDGQTYRYLINNANFESYIKIVKTDSETGKTIPYAGAGFKLYKPDGSLITQTFTYPTPTTIDTFYTNSEGYLVTPEKLEYGSGYYLIEVQAPYGYVLNSDPVYFDVTEENSHDENGLTIVVAKKPNKPQKGVIKISKDGEVFSSVTETDGIYQPIYEVKGLEGAVYEITAAKDIVTLDGTVRAKKGDVVDTVTTDENGSIVSKELYLGKYEVKEITAPYGMVLNDKTNKVELTYAGQEVEITETETSFYNERQRVQIDLNKVMEQDEKFNIGKNGEITAVSFGIYASEDITASDGTVIPKDGLIEIVSCKEDGQAVFETDFPVDSKLYVKEYSTDEHYVISDEIYPVEFKYEGQDVETVYILVSGDDPIENKIIRGNIKGLKVDRETNQVIKGAIFGLFKSDETDYTEETALLTAETDESGVFTFENIPYGNWIVRELKPAEGYLSNNENYVVSVVSNEQVIEFTVVNDRIPELGTTATVDGEKEINATEVFTLDDVVSYKHLIPGKEYTVKGILMDKSTNKPLIVNGETVVSSVTFIPQTPSGEITVKFTFDSKYIKQNTKIVVFESIYRNNTELAVHADINDKGQTVKVKTPKIGTKATANGKKEITAKGTVKIKDIVSYKNLTPGKKYTIKGVLMNKKTNKPLLVDGKQIHAKTVFEPKKSNGKVTVTFEFDAKYLKTDTEIVVFESLYRKGVEIAVHENIKDKGQTVKINLPAPDIPQTGDSSLTGFLIGLGAIALGGLASIGIIHYKRRKDDDK